MNWISFSYAMKNVKCTSNVTVITYFSSSAIVEFSCDCLWMGNFTRFGNKINNNFLYSLKAHAKTQRYLIKRHNREKWEITMRRIRLIFHWPPVFFSSFFFRFVVCSVRDFVNEKTIKFKTMNNVKVFHSSLTTAAFVAGIVLQKNKNKVLLTERLIVVQEIVIFLVENSRVFLVYFAVLPSRTMGMSRVKECE